MQTFDKIATGTVGEPQLCGTSLQFRSLFASRPPKTLKMFAFINSGCELSVPVASVWGAFWHPWRTPLRLPKNPGSASYVFRVFSCVSVSFGKNVCFVINPSFIPFPATWRCRASRAEPSSTSSCSVRHRSRRRSDKKRLAVTWLPDAAGKDSDH